MLDGIFAGPRIVAVSMDATTTPERVMAVVDSLQARYGPLQVYVAGNSLSSGSTMRLGERMDGKLAGFIHIGTPAKPAEDRPRPALSDIVTRF